MLFTMVMERKNTRVKTREFDEAVDRVFKQ